MTTLTKPTVANLRKASRAIYLACEEEVAADISNLLAWSADWIEKAAKMRLAINDVELALAGLEIDDLVAAWDGAADGVTAKVNLGALRQLARSYPALNHIMNNPEFDMPSSAFPPAE